MKSTVSLQRCTSYDSEKLKKAISSIFLPFGGAGKIIHKNDRVLIKPNLLKPARPDEAVTTHPLFIKALLEMCLDLGGKPIIGDSPGFFSLKRVSEVTGLQKIADELGVKVCEFNNPIPVKSIRGGEKSMIFENNPSNQTLRSIGTESFSALFLYFFPIQLPRRISSLPRALLFCQ